MADRRGPLLMGIDAGTQSARVGLCDAEGVLLASASAPYPTSYPGPGRAEQFPRDWWRALCSASRECLGASGLDPARIAGLSFDATSSTVLLVDGAGEPAGPAILWMDQRAAAEAELVARTAHPVLRYSGGSDSAEWMVPKALWLKRNEPEAYARAAKVVEATDWIGFKLTGRWAASRCNATCKWNYATVEGGWPADFFAALGAPELPSKWPEAVLPLGAPLGPLAAGAAEEMGLPTGVPVIEGGIDAHVGLLGLNALDASRMGLIVGSSSVMFVQSDRPAFPPGFWGPYPEAVLEGSWLVEAGQTSSGSIVNWLVDNLSAGRPLRGAERAAFLSRLEEEAAALPPGSEGLVMLDYWQGNRTPLRDPRAKGLYFGLTLAHDYRHLARAAYEGIVFGTKFIIDSLRASGISVEGAAAGGGGTRSRLWLQLTADVCGIPIAIPRNADSCGVLGSAIAAAAGAGVYPSLRAAAAAMTRDERVVRPAGDGTAYAEGYARYRELYERTKALLEGPGPG